MPFARGYHIEIGGGRNRPGAGVLGGSQTVLGGGYGQDLKANLRKLYGANVHFAGRGEMIPNEDSYCEIDPNVVDQWGIPVLRFHFKWSQDEDSAGEAHAGNVPADYRNRRWRGYAQIGRGPGLGHLGWRRNYS